MRTRPCVNVGAIGRVSYGLPRLPSFHVRVVGVRIHGVVVSIPMSTPFFQTVCEKYSRLLRVVLAIALCVSTARASR